MQLRNHEKQSAVFAVALVLLVICTIVVCLRCVARLTIRALGWDDWSMIAGALLFVGTAVSMLVAALAGIGVKDEFLIPVDVMRALHAFTAFEPFYITSLTFIKMSICLTLLRFAQEGVLRRIVILVLILDVLSGITAFVGLLSFCHPISATWKLEPDRCVTDHVVVGFAYFISATAIVTDFTCAIIPCILFYRMRMSARLKWSASALMGLGFTASAATIVRLNYIGAYTATTNHLYALANPCIWTMVECGLGILAGSAPALKPLILRYCDSSELRENRLMSTNFILKMLKPISRAYVHEESVVTDGENLAMPTTRSVSTAGSSSITKVFDTTNVDVELAPKMKLHDVVKEQP